MSEEPERTGANSKPIGGPSWFDQAERFVRRSFRLLRLLIEEAQTVVPAIIMLALALAGLWTVLEALAQQTGGP